MRHKDYPKERTEKEVYRCRKTIQTKYKKQISHAFDLLLSSVHHIHIIAGFLFNLDQSTIYRDIQKIESLIRKCVPIPKKIYNITKKRLQQTPEDVEKEILSWIYGFHRFHYRAAADTKTYGQQKTCDILFWQK